MEILLLSILIGIVAGVTYFFEEKTITPEKPAYVTGEMETRVFTWNVDGTTKTYSLNCSVDIRLDQYHNAQQTLDENSTPPNKTFMTSDNECFKIASVEILDQEFGKGANEVQQIINYLDGYAQNEFLSHYEVANITLNFVHEQCIRYQYDHESKNTPEYFRFPIETIYDTKGDCDCKAILASAIFKALGYDVAFALMPGHAALAISLGPNMPYANFSYGGKEWYYCEATGDHWRPGALPDGLRSDSVHLREV